ncbi:MAG: c-type cytochrome [Candidatus Kapaibacterium sp.]|nr:c-type cytochrome [Ignavibacteriota bacterium]MCB9221650.1 c-type cytochrome [Ignavibacteria bacterium]
MLSKNQARTFFVVGTVFFTGVFFYLSYDTVVNHVDKQTNSQNMSAEVVRGKRLFDENNCMGCHTIMGEGAYYAPELTKVYERRGPDWIDVFMDDPEAMFPGERKMVKYNFTKEEKADLIAFFKWVGEIDLNGFPPEPDKGAFASTVITTTGSAAVEEKPSKWSLCSACHSLGGSGGNVGPALDGVGNKFDADYLRKWISDPQSVKPGTAMPKLPLSDAEREEMVEFLSKLK